MTRPGLAHRLSQARSQGSTALLDQSDAIADVEEAYRIQTELSAINRDGVLGWKVTALSPPEQQRFLSSRPVAGALLGGHFHPSPAALELSGMISPLLECEIAFTLALDLPPRSTSYQLSEVEAAIEDVVAVIEIADSRLPAGSSYLLQLADCMSNGALVTGGRKSARKKIDLRDIEVFLTLDGKELERGNSSRILGNPLLAVVALANAQPLPAGGLRKGQIVTTGTCTTPVELSKGEYVADFRSLGAVRVTIT